MDPSEFEDTVEKSADVINAGALEDLFLSRPRVSLPDLSSLTRESEAMLVSLREAAQRLPSAADLEAALGESDGSALRVAELKEECVQRRRKLVATVKRFFATHIDAALVRSEGEGEREENTGEGEEEPLVSLARESREVVELFKREFDFLSSFSKLAEHAFLSSYKLSHALPDVKQLLEDATQALSKQQEALKRANELLAESQRERERDTHTHAHSPDAAHSLTSSISIADLVPSAALSKAQQQHEQQLQRLREELARERETHLSELVSVKSRLEMERKTLEHALQSKYEEEAVRRQQQLEALLASKEEKLQFLAGELQNQQLRAVEAEEQRKHWESETRRRQQSEEKLQQTVLELAGLQEERQSLQREKDALQDALQQLTAQIENATKVHNREKDALKERVHTMESELAVRPPLDLSLFLEKIGRGAAISSETPRWEETEAMIVEHMRRAESEIVTSRLKQQEQENALQSLAKQVKDLQARLKSKEAELATAERDLFSAHEALQQQRQQHVSSEVSSGKQIRAVRKTLLTVEDAESPHPQGPFDDLDALLAESEYKSSSVEPSSAASSSSMLRVVQHQRDRFMKATRELEEELSVTKNKLERLQEEQTALRNDNLELYRRMRMLRAGNGAKAPPLDRKEKNDEEEQREGDEADIERKYNNIYEQEMLSPFKIAELEKQNYLSKMSTMDRVVAWIYRNVMQDQWMRHAFLFYLAFVHMLALSYVFQVLNPELIDEVDAHLKAKWSQETLSLPEHPDV